MRASKRSRQLLASIAFLFLALIGLLGMGADALAKYRSVDLVRLLGAGACFGVALMSIGQTLAGRRRNGA